MHKNTSLLIEDFVTLKAGEAFRLFPFGKIYKNGKAREITAEFARTVQLPHFKAPIKLGSHEDATPAGGFITALEVREDGIYAVPEWNEQGEKAMQDGAYRYNSPEILWDGGLENPTTGDAINVPMIIGTALLHTPHLGEAAALYSVEEISQENNMEQMNIPLSFWEKFIAPLLSKPAEKVEVIKTVEPEDYSAIKAENEQYKAEIERQKAEATRKTRIEKYETEIKETKADPTLAEILADLPEEKAAAIMKQFRAHSEQIKESNLTKEQGTPEGGSDVDPKTQFNLEATKLSLEKNINYVDAFEACKKLFPDLFAQGWGR